MKTLRHDELIVLGTRWLRRSHSGTEFRDSHDGYRYSHPVVLKELVSMDFSVPDIIGFCAEYSTVIECKSSRRDYHADKLKSHRHRLKQPGNYRYYLTPQGMIRMDEIHDGWGLLETNGHGVLVKLAAPYHCEPEIKVAEYHILYSFARRKQDKLLSKRSKMVDYKIGKKFRLGGPKKYFELKYGNAYPVIEIREEADFHKHSSPPAFLYIGRVLTEGKPELLRGKTYYGYIEGTGEGEFVHESELATLVTDII